MFGEYAPFILPAYIITSVALAVAALWIMATHRARKRELQKLEEAGLKRRSEGRSR